MKEITVRQVHSEKDCGPITNGDGSGKVPVRFSSIVFDGKEPERRRQGDFLVRNRVWKAAEIMCCERQNGITQTGFKGRQFQWGLVDSLDTKKY